MKKYGISNPYEDDDNEEKELNEPVQSDDNDEGEDNTTGFEEDAS